MADIESNIKVNIDTSDALAQLKLLQQQISAFQQAMRNAGSANAQAAAAMQQNLVNSINATGQFRANIQTIKTSAESFTESLEKNKMSIGEYFRYAGGASKTFGKLFKSEFATIQQVAEERVKTLQTQFIKLGRDANGAMKAIAVKPLALDMENLGTKTQIAAQKQQLFNQLMKQGSTNLLNFGKNTQWAGRQLMVGFTVPLTMAGAAAAKSYMQIEQASIKFKRVYGDMQTTTAEANKMAKSVQSLANEFTKYGLAVADTMDMAASAAAMGKTGAELLAQVNEASRLAVLGGVEQQQALETTISLTNAFGIEANKLSGSIDFLNAVENQTVLSIEDLTIAIPKAAPVIQQLGGDFKDLAFFMTAMKEGGINAAEGANALKSGLASMINPTGKATQFLQSFGINLKGIVEANKGDIKGTVVQFAKALDTLDPLNRARAIEQLFGKFQFARISTLFKNVIDEGSQAARVAGLAKDTAQELAILSEREMKKVSDSPMFKFQKAVQDMQAKLAPVGEAFLKAVTPVIEFVGKILDGFNGMSEGAKQFATIATVAIAGIGPILLMTFGLIANGVANIMKLFVNLKSFFNKTGNKTDILGEQTKYMNTEQLRAAAIASSLDQAHAKLRQTFTSEAAAVQALTKAYRDAVAAQGAYAGIPGVPVGNAGTKPRKYAGGTHMVPGPAGAGDIVPALLSPGEAVIPAKQAQKYRPIISGMISGNLPGFETGTSGVGMPKMTQSIIGPLTLKQTEGMARTALQLEEISKEVMAGPYGKVVPTNYGRQLEPSPGHSFPAFGVGGIYQKPDGSKVFVKPQVDLTAAMAEMRGTQIARDAHGLEAPSQKLGVMIDPTDPQGKRRFIVLESKLEDKFANIPTTFTKNQYIKQLVASLLRGDKDLGLGNLGGNILADVGPAGVFQRASGKRELGGRINSMEEQAIINLLGVKGGAKRFFAESTSDIARNMKPSEFDAAIKNEIKAVMPKLAATIAGFGKMRPVETAAYRDMLKRLQAGLGVDWTKYHAMHSNVPAKKYEDGIDEVGKKSNKKPRSLAEAMQAMSQQEIREKLNIEDTHITLDLDTTNPQVLSQIKRVYPDITEKDLRYQSARSNLTAQMPGNLNQRMRRGASGWRAPVFGNVWNGFRGKLSKIASMHGMEIPSLQAVEDEIGRELALLPLATDTTVGDTVEKILKRHLSPEKDPDGVRRALWDQAQSVGTMRTDIKGANANMTVNQSLIEMLKLKAAVWKKTGGGGYELWSASGSHRIGMFDVRAGSGKPTASKEDKELRLKAQEAAKKWVEAGNWDAPMPIVKDKPNAPTNMFKIGPKGQPKISPTTGKPMLQSGWIQLALVSADTPAGKFSQKASKKEGRIGKFISYDDAYLKTAPQTSLDFTPGKEQILYNTLMQNGGELVPPKTLPFWMALSSQLSRGGVIPGYANGVFSVPGPKGAGDVVPAMLSPGEAVIPAKQATQNRGLIAAMIDGKIPGYDGGLLPPPPSSIPGVQAPAPYVPPANSGGFLQKAKSVADSVAKNGLGAVAKGMEVGKNALIKAGDKALTQILTSDARKADSEERLRVARLERTRLHLEANNEEYAELKRESELYQEQKMVKDPTKSEQAQQSARTRKMRSLEAQMEADFQATGKDPTKKMGKDGSKEAWGKMSGKFSQIGMTASFAAGALSMMPGPLGQIAQQATPAIAGLSTLASFISGPVSGGIVALVAVVGSMWLAIDGLNKKFEESVISAKKSKDAIGASTAAIRKLSEFNKTVTAGELMDKVRANKLVGIGAAPGKTTFGESYVKSEQGTAFIKEIKTKIKESGGITDEVIRDYASQLSMAVASGAINDKQAASIAANVGAALGDSNFAFKVRAQVGEIIGPNGENLTKDPIKIAAIIEARSSEDIKMGQQNLTKAVQQNRLWSGGENTSLNRSITAGGTALAMAGGGAGVGAGIGAAVGSIIPGVGTAIGAAVGTVIGSIGGAIAGYFTAMGTLQKQAEDAGKMSGAMLGDITIALQQQKEMGDIIDKQFMQKMEQAKLEGDITKQKELQLQYDQARNRLADINKTLVTNVLDSYTQSSDTVKESLDLGAETALQAKYKENPEQLMFLDAIKTGMGNAPGITRDQKFLLQTEMISENILPQDMSKLVGLMTDEDMTTKIMKIVTDYGATTATQFGQTLGMIKDENVRKEVALAVSSAGTSDEALKILDLVQKVEAFGGVISADVIVSYFEENPDIADKVQGFMDAFEKSGDKLTAEAAISIDQKLKGNIDEDYFAKLKTKDKNQYLQVVESIIQVAPSEIMMTDDFKRWLNDEGATLGAFPGDHSNAWWVSQYAKQRAFKITSETPASALDIGGADQKEPEAPKASFLDPYVEAIRNASNWQQKLTVGFAASLKAMRAQEGALGKFAGLAERLKSYGADANFIQAALGGDQADIDKVIDRATGKLTKAGRDAIRIAKEVENAKIGMAYVIASDSERRQKDNELYQAGLEVISAKEKKINEKYDIRIKALDEIGKLQEKNNQLQQNSLDLADALSKGDIAAAARIALKAKQDSQKQALEDAKTGIENARKGELSQVTTGILGKSETRESLEAKIAANSEKIAIAKKDELDSQIKIGKHAVITAKKMAEILASGKAIAGLKGSVGGGTGGGTSNTGTTDTGTTDTGTTATTLNAQQAITGLNAAKKFSGNVSTLKNLGADELKAKKDALVDKRDELKSSGLYSKFIVTDSSGKQKIADRGSVANQAAFDTWLKEYNAAKTAVSDFEGTVQRDKKAEFAKLPKQVQQALDSLKSYNEQKKALNQQIKDATTSFEAQATKEIGKDSSGNWKDIGPGGTNEARYKQLRAPLVALQAQATGLSMNIRGIDQALAAKGYTPEMTEFYIGQRFARGGMVYASRGISTSEYALGTDTIPAMLTPGEFVMSKAAVDRIGSESLSAMNNGSSAGESVYNYNITVNANSSDANDIADAVFRQIKRIDAQRIRSSGI